MTAMDWSSNTATKRVAVFYRMDTPAHICPFGLKSRDLIERQGYAVDDRTLPSRGETDAFKAKHDVKTTPQTFVGGSCIGGYDDLRRHFGLGVPDTEKKTYAPVIAVFAVSALMALSLSRAIIGNPPTANGSSPLPCACWRS